MTLMPGDPVELMIQSNPKITSEDISRLRQLYGLDQPVYKRYATWVNTLAHGDLGYSRTYRIPVSELIGAKLMNTFVLSMTSLILSLIVAIPLGVFAALRPGSKMEAIINLFAFSGISMPSFWLGLMLMIIFAQTLHLFPAGGTATVGMEDAGLFPFILDRAKYLVLPTISLAYMEIGAFVRYVRSSMLEALRNDYIRTAKAKGLNRKIVIWKHAFRNALLPLVTMVTLSLSGVFSGALISETVFAYQGAGKLVYDSIIANDFNVAMVSFVISVVMVLLMNLLADILYGVVDPRISFK
jgi:peptide/nickel transport system permease protein